MTGGRQPAGGRGPVAGARHAAAALGPLACGLAATLALAGSAHAAGQEQREIVAADQKRAASMLLQRSDAGFGFRTQPLDKGEGDDGSISELQCPTQDFSDLTLSGQKEGRAFSRKTRRSFAVVASSAYVYVTEGQARTAWQRSTGSAGERCLRTVFRTLFKGSFVSLRRVGFARVAEATRVYRALVRSDGVPVYFDLILLRQRRAVAAVLCARALTPMSRRDELRLAEIVGGRMIAAMSPEPPAPAPPLPAP